MKQPITREVPTARQIQSAIKAGLVLVGRDDEGKLEWLGEGVKWQMYDHLLTNN